MKAVDLFARAGGFTKGATQAGLSIRKIGTNRGKRRLWLQGAILEAAGFKPGDRFEVSHPKGFAGLVFVKLAPNEKPEEGNKARKVSGKGTLPIVGHDQ